MKNGKETSLSSNMMPQYVEEFTDQLDPLKVSTISPKNIMDVFLIIMDCGRGTQTIVSESLSLSLLAQLILC